MELAPPPAPGSRVQELGDRLVIRFRPSRSRWETGFLSCFLVAMVLIALEMLGQAPGGFEIVWTCGWLAGTCAGLLGLAWKLAGHEILIVTPGGLEVRKEIGRFARTKRFDAALVRDVGPARFPVDDESAPRDDFCLRVLYGTKPVRVGEGMERREAEEVADRVLGWIRPRESWPADAHVFYDRLDADPWHEDIGWIPLVRATLFAVVIVFCLFAVVVWLGDGTEAVPRDGDTARRVDPGLVNRPPAVPQVEGAPRAPGVGAGPADRPPSPGDFADVRSFAAAATLHALRRSRTTPFDMPVCSGRWSAWSCTVLARSREGPYAYRVMPYRCSSGVRQHREPSPYVVDCGPVDPPPLPTVGES